MHAICNPFVHLISWFFLAVVPFFFIQKLISLISEVNPTSLFVALDVGKSFRKDLSPKYKAHRKPKPRSMQEQVQKHKILSSKLKTKIDK